MNLFKTASMVSVLTLMSRVTGLVRELLMASMFGASGTTDAFQVAFRIPNLLRRLFAEGAFSQAFVPVLAAYKAQQGEQATRLVIDHVVTVLVWALSLTCLVGVVGAPALVTFMASGLKDHANSFDLAVVMTRYMFPYIGFMSLVAVAAGVLNTWQRFAVPAVTPVLLNISMIGAAVWGAPWFGRMGLEPIYAMVGGVMVGGMLQLAVQMPALHRLGLLPRIGLSWRALQHAWHFAGTQKVLSLMAPAILGVSVAQISLLINTQIASHLQQGSVSWLTYADRLMEFPTAMLGVAIGSVLLPQLSAAKSNQHTEKYSQLLDWGLRWVFLMAVPASVALVLFAKPVVAVMYHYGAFTAKDVNQTATALMGYGIGLMGLISIKVLAPGFYASQNTKTPVKIAVMSLCLTQLMNLVFVPIWAHAGLALSIGVGAWFNALCLYVGLRRSGAYKPQPGWTQFGLQVAASAALLSVYLLWISNQMVWMSPETTKLIRIMLFSAAVLLAVLIYFVSLTLSGLRLRAFLKSSF